MLKSVEGIYRDGKAELLEPLGGPDGSRVIVTLIHPRGQVDLRERGIDSLRPPICAVGSLRLMRTGNGPSCLYAMICRRGDVVLVLFPGSNLRTAKRRPAVVVQADRLGTGLPQTVVAMITSNMARGTTRAGSSCESITRKIDRVVGAFTSLNETDQALRTTLAL